ncbi:hypothetical protein F0562_015188 [Nyssa sinensis]|uniref:Uncharacterized protein n=1 Tax=Nyssa sinensis TaxID=561372 RepID=A0A5J4ZIS1_9ASTE|nr:hypothetical protein F0562_015188 [Nyssa sinensis]
MRCDLQKYRVDLICKLGLRAVVSDLGVPCWREKEDQKVLIEIFCASVLNPAILAVTLPIEQLLAYETDTCLCCRCLLCGSCIRPVAVPWDGSGVAEMDCHPYSGLRSAFFTIATAASATIIADEPSTAVAFVGVRCHRRVAANSPSSASSALNNNQIVIHRRLSSSVVLHTNIAVLRHHGRSHLLLFHGRPAVLEF